MSKFSNVGSRLVNGALHFFSKVSGDDLLVLDPDADTVTIRNIGDLSFGPATVIAEASDVLTIPAGASYVAVAAETSTTGGVVTITKAGAAEGQLLLLTCDAGDTITVDNANIQLGAATRVLDDGGHILLRYDGTDWVEMTFLTAADHVD